MEGRDKVIIIAASGRGATAAAVKEKVIEENANALPIIIGAEDMKGLWERLLLGKVFKEGGAAFTAYNKGRNALAIRNAALLPEKIHMGPIGKSLENKVENIFYRYTPSEVIVIGGAFLLAVLNVRNASHSGVKVRVVVDDFACPMNIIHKAVDEYVVPNTGVLTTLANYGVSEHKVKIAEFPISNKFKTLASQNKINGSPKDKYRLFLQSEESAFDMLAYIKNAPQYNGKTVVYAGSDAKLADYSARQGYTVYRTGMNPDELIVNCEEAVGPAFSPFIARALLAGKKYTCVKPIGYLEEKVFAFASGMGNANFIPEEK